MSLVHKHKSYMILDK